MSLSQIFASRASRMKASETRELLKLMDQPGLISFAGGIPDPALFPAQDFAAVLADGLRPERQAQMLQYSASEGYLPLRKWIVAEMAKIGVPCTAENVLITSGSQQALDYLGKLFLSPGDTALVGWPTYLGALGAFSAYEPRFDQLTVDGNRSADSYAEAAETNGGRVKIAYLSPDFSNPTGETLDLRGRHALLDLTEQLGCALIEDAAYQSLRYEGEPVAPLLALEIAKKGSIEECQTIYCGSFSKTLSPGLRVGWVVSSTPVISQLVLMKQSADLHTATLNQMAVHEVAERVFDEHVKMLRDVYGQRRKIMLSALKTHMPKGVTWTKPEGGMFIWVTLPPSVDGAELLARCLETANVAFVPGRAFYADRSGGNTIRLSFSCAGEAEINEGIRKLADVLRAG